MDTKVTLEELRKKYKAVRVARDWDPSLRSLGISIVLEAGELLEHFQWYDDSQFTNRLKKKPEIRKEIEMEVGDILNYLCEFADKMDIDFSTACEKTIAKINEKYPAVKAKDPNWREFYDQQKKKYRQNKGKA